MEAWLRDENTSDVKDELNHYTKLYSLPSQRRLTYILYALPDTFEQRHFIT